jgi:hypothetical protein
MLSGTYQRVVRLHRAPDLDAKPRYEGRQLILYTGGCRTDGHHPLQLQEDADAFKVVQAQRHLTVLPGAAGLRHAHCGPVTHTQDCLVHLLAVRDFRLVFQAVLSVRAWLLEGEPMATIHRAQPQE